MCGNQKGKQQRPLAVPVEVSKSVQPSDCRGRVNQTAAVEVSSCYAYAANALDTVLCWPPKNLRSQVTCTAAQFSEFTVRASAPFAWFLPVDPHREASICQLLRLPLASGELLGCVHDIDASSRRHAHQKLGCQPCHRG